MRLLPVFTLPLVCLTISTAGLQAVAQQPANADTYREVIARGVVLLTGEYEIDVKFMPEGRFVALGGFSKGDWKIAGDKLCTRPEETGVETCSVYPAGKKSGDEFKLPTPNGDVTVRIR